MLIMLDRFGFRLVSTFAVICCDVFCDGSCCFVRVFPCGFPDKDIGSRQLEQVRLLRSVRETCLMTSFVIFVLLHVCPRDSKGMLVFFGFDIS